MSKPLYKDPSFWIVVVTLVGAADVSQFYFGLPWFKERILNIQPAPRAAASPVPVANVLNQPANLDDSKKTYLWQTPRPNPQLFRDAPPQVVLIPSEYTAPSGGWSSRQSNAVIGIRMPTEYVVQSAYGWTSRNRLILPDQMPAGQFDFIAKQPSGALEALQAEIKQKLGLVAERELLPTNVLFLKLDHTNAPGLTPTTSRPTTPVQNQPGMQNFRSVRIGTLATLLEAQFRLPLIDQTGLPGTYDIQFPMVRRLPGQATSDMVEQANKVFIEQLGLELVETNAPVEMLVVKKIK